MAKKSALDIESIFDKLGAKPESFLKTNVLPIDTIFGGEGIPRSGYIHLWGPAGTGKSSCCLSIARELAKQGLKTMYLSVEPSNKLFTDMGLDDSPFDSLVRQASPVTYNETEEALAAFFESDYSFCVLDSVSALSKTNFDIVDGDSQVEDTKVAEDAMVRLRLIKKIHAAMRRRNDKAMILVFHTSSNFGGNWFSYPYLPEGGQKMVQFSVASILMDGGSIIYDPADPKRILGRDLLLKSPVKNRFSVLGGSFKVGLPIRVVFGKGIASTYTLASYCVFRGYIKLGAWSQCNFNGVEEKVQGKLGRVSWIKDHYAELVEDYYQHVADYLQAVVAGFDAGDVL